jgi:hypothetical protein
MSELKELETNIIYKLIILNVLKERYNWEEM